MMTYVKHLCQCLRKGHVIIEVPWRALRMGVPWPPSSEALGSAYQGAFPAILSGDLRCGLRWLVVTVICSLLAPTPTHWGLKTH